MKPPLQTLTHTKSRNELLGRQPQMHEIAKPTPVTLAIFILTAACFAEVCDGRELGIERSTFGRCEWGDVNEERVNPYRHTNGHSSCRPLLVLPFPTRIAHTHFRWDDRLHYHKPMFPKNERQASNEPLTHMQLEQIPKLCKLTIEILVYRIESLLKFFFGQLANGVVGWVVVHVG
jgi:hypothetical protein